MFFFCILFFFFFFFFFFLFFVKVAGYYAKPYGLNTVGLERQGFTQETMKYLKQAYKILYRQGLTIVKALDALRQIECESVRQMMQFVEASQAGIVR